MNEEIFGVYAAKHINENIRFNSQSGGAFTAISDYVLNCGGVVYGCILNEHFEAVHMRAEDHRTRDAMRGSKYVQSKMGDSFRNVKVDLEAGRAVLFTGTSCQVAGLQKFLGKNYEDLICVDILCHGTPSPRVWREYLAWLEEKSKKRVCQADFRNTKDYGWSSHIETLYMDDGSRINSEVFKNIFYGHYALREACHACPYKSIYHPGDITIGDFWGLDKAISGFKDSKGVSLIIINSSKGQTVFEKIRSAMDCRETEIEKAMQDPMVAPFPRPQDRERFWELLDRKGFGKVAVAYGDYGYCNKIRHLYRRGLRKIKRIVERVFWRKG